MACGVDKWLSPTQSMPASILYVVHVRSVVCVRRVCTYCMYVVYVRSVCGGEGMVRRGVGRKLEKLKR